MKKGFSLAEVLLTLGILGFIASVTFPTLNSNIWKGQREALLKSAYARLKNVMDTTIVELGYTPKCAYYRDGNPNGITQERHVDENGNVTWTYKKNGQDYELQPGENFNGQFDDCEIFGKTILKNLRIVKECSGTNNCKPEYNGIEKVHTNNNNTNLTAEEKEIQAKTATAGLSGYETNSLRKNYAFHTGNNYTLINHAKEIYFYPAFFAVDTNGNKGPNKWGQDLFPFRLSYGRSGKNIELVPVSANYFKENYGGLSGIDAIDILRNR